MKKFIMEHFLFVNNADNKCLIIDYIIPVQHTVLVQIFAANNY